MITKRRNGGSSGLDELPDDARAWLDGEDSGTFHFFATDDELAELWRLHGDEVVAEHVAASPGSRPAQWWERSAPRQPAGSHPGLWYDGKLPLPRQRISGVGTECSARLAHVPRYQFGIPVDWITEDLLRTYEKLKSPLNVLAVDPKNPPVFEAEATYLERHGLLIKGERARLTDKDFEPEALAI